MNKIFFTISITILSSTFLFNDAKAFTDSGTCGVNCNWSYDSSTQKILITGGENGEIGEMNNYATWRGELQPWAEYSIKSVDVSGVRNIGDNAFNSFHITELNIRDSVEQIGDNTFNNNNLINVILPNSIKRLDSEAFYGNDNLTISLPDSLETVNSDVFNGINSLEIIISDNLNFNGWDSDALADGDDVFVSFKCKGLQKQCENNIKEYINIVENTPIENITYGTANETQCTGNYGWTGKNCARKDENGNVTCASGYADYKNKCWDELPFSKKHWTPAEAVQWLNEDDNTITITFKK